MKAFLALLMTAAPLAAHGINVAFAEIKIGDQQVAIRLHLPVLDSDQAFRIDSNGNGFFDRDELLAATPRAHQYLAPRLRVIQDGREIPAQLGPLQMWTGPDGNPFVETTATFALASSGLRQLSIQCDVFREQSPGFQTVAFITIAGRNEQFVFDKGSRYEVSVASKSGLAFLQFLQMGVLHIFTGYDHIAFLLGVVLIGGTFRSLVKIVTSFTVAHSITLALAALEIVTLPSRLVESGIALSIMYIALENLFFQKFDRRWIVTFFFGLVHGFGFASALREVRLPSNLLATALVSFNLGVEVGQVVIVALLLPVLWQLEKSRYRTVAIHAASSAIFLLGCFWLWQRLR